MSKHTQNIADVQSTADIRNIAINRVGIKDLSHPISVIGKDGNKTATVASFSMSVSLPHDKKGTHMSRFVEQLNSSEIEISAKNFNKLLTDMTQRLEAKDGYIEMQFPFFVKKTAPVSGVESLMDYQISLAGQIENGHINSNLEIVVPVKSLCPCSKKISEFGAHNQRSHITVGINCSNRIWLEDVIKLVEQQASAELFAILKRPDEKYITEQAYNNPKFVEDVVRDVANTFNQTEAISHYYIHAENFESIHNHSAFAIIEHDKNLG